MVENNIKYMEKLPEIAKSLYFQTPSVIFIVQHEYLAGCGNSSNLESKAGGLWLPASMG